MPMPVLPPGPQPAGCCRRPAILSRPFAIEQLEPRIVPATNLVSGTLAVDTVWLDGDVQQITGDVTVPFGVTLTIQPGAIIQFDPVIGADLIVGGTLVAAGTNAKHILFTSVRDDSGPDGILGNGDDLNTANDPNAPAAGDWGKIEFQAGSTLGTLSFWDVRYAGAGFGVAVAADQSLTFSNSKIQNTAGIGLRLQGVAATLANATFLNNSGAAIQMDLASDPTFTGTPTFTNNAWNGVDVTGSALLVSTTWNDPSVVYRLSESVNVLAGRTLTLGAGQIVKLVGILTVNGSLVANGTALAPVIFTNTRDDSAGGNSDNGGPGPGFDGTHTITFTSTATASLLDHAEVRYFDGIRGAIEMDGVPSGAVTIQDSLIRNSADAGIYLLGSNPTLARVTFQDNPDAAVRADPLSDPVITAPVFSNNLYNGYFIQNGVFGTTTTWNDPDIVYVLGSDFVVPAGKTLTIEAGQILKGGGGGSRLQALGTLNVNGTAQAPVIFTSLNDDSAGGDTNNDAAATAAARGDWPGLNLLPGSTAAINRMELRYGGQNAFIETGSLNLTQVASFTMSDSVVRDSFGTGIRIEQSNPTLTHNTFQNNKGSAMSTDLVSHPVITNPGTISGNGINGLTLDGGTLPSGASTWNQIGVPYFLRGEVIVPVDGTLTVAPGQVIKSIDGGDILVRGILNAVGTAALPIIFTSDSDDSVFGRTNTAPSNPVFASAGEWLGLRFTSAVPGNAPGVSMLDHVEVRYAGGLSSTAGAITVAGGSLDLQNSIVRDSRNFHVRIEDSSPFFSGNTFSGATSAALGMDLNSDPEFGPNTFINNNTDTLLLDSGNMRPGGVNWDDPEIVYDIRQQIIIPAGTTLNIAPGMVIKVESLPVTGSPSALFVAGTLNAAGTVDQPIVFTSWHDNTAGGATATRAPGFWGGIQLRNGSGGHVLDHVDIRFTHSAAIDVLSTSATIRNTLIGDIGSGSGLVISNSSVTLTSSVISTTNPSGNNYGVLFADSTLIATNNTIHGFGYGVGGAGSNNLTLTNNLITGSRTAGVSFSGPFTASFNDVYSLPGVPNWFVDVGTDPSNTNGNRSFDPQYVNPQALNLRLRSISAAIDAGTSTGAPVLDIVNAPRFDNPGTANTGGGANPFVDLGAYESLAGTSANVDLTVTAVSSTTPSGLPGELATVSWTVRNVGTGPTQVPWKDAIYLSRDAIFSPDDVLVGEAPHSAVLGAGLMYSNTTTVPLPSVLPGDYHFIVRANASGDVIEGANLANNPGGSAGTIAMDLPALTLGADTPGTLTQPGQAKFYKVIVPAGDDLQVALDGPAGFGNELYIRQGDLPTRQIFDARAVVDGPDQNVAINGTEAGVYYVMVYGDDVPGLESFTVNADLADFKISSVGPALGSNAGLVTVSISGAKFVPGSQPELVDFAGATIQPLAVYFTDSGQISATFDLRNHPTGLADVRVVNPGNVSTTLVDSIEIVSGQEGRLVTNLIAPAEARIGRQFQLVIEYFNAGFTDLLAPVLRVEGSALTQLSLDPDFLDTATTFSLVGTSSDGPAGILAPGEKGRIIVFGKAVESGTETFNLYQETYPSTPIDWAALGAALKPDDLTTAEWNPIVARLQANIGTTWASYRQAISNDATLLPAASGLNYSLEDVLRFEVDKAIADLETAVGGKLFLGDLNHPLRNVEIRLYDSATGESLFTASRNDGTFLFPEIAPGTYEVTFSGHVLPVTGTLTVGANDVNNLQFIVNPGGVLAGQVVRGGVGAPLPGVAVTATSDDGQSFSTLTDANGNYFFDSLSTGTFSVVAGGGTLTQSVLGGLAVVAGEQKLHADLSLQTGASLSGLVSGPSGLLANVTVSAFDANGLGFSAVTDATGAFTIVGLSGQTYSVSALANGFSMVTTMGVVVPAGGVKTGVNFTLSGSGGISGTVAPLAGGALTTPVDIVFTGPNGIFETSTLPDGTYSIAGLPPGHYTIKTASDLFMTRTTATDVTAGASVNVPLTVAARGQVSGTITAVGTGLPVQKVIVFAQDANGVIASTVTDSLGHYTLSGFDVGTVQITLGDDDSPGLVRTPRTFDANNVSLTANLSVPVSGIVSGVVYDEMGLPLADTLVGLTQNGQNIVSMFTDENGNYAFVVVRNGTYQLEVAGADLAFPVISGLVLDGNDTVTGQDFHPGNKGITGIVRDGNGMPVMGALVSIDRADPNLAYTLVTILVTGADGTFSYTGAVPGAYTLTAEAPGLAYDVESVIVTNGAAPNVMLDLGVEGTIHGTVRGPGSALLEGAQLILSRTGFDLTFVAVSNATGNFDFTGLAPGTYRATVVAPNHQTLLVTNVTVAAGDQLRDFTLAAGTIQVSGTVSNASTALGQITVTATDANGFVFAQDTTSFDGHYSLGTLPAGQYTLTASGTGYAPASIAPITVANGNGFNSTNLTIVPTAMSDITLDVDATRIISGFEVHAFGPAVLKTLPISKGYVLEAGDQDLLFKQQKDSNCEAIRGQLVRESIALREAIPLLEAERARLTTQDNLDNLRTLVRDSLNEFNAQVKSVENAVQAFLHSNLVQKKIRFELEFASRDIEQILVNVRGWLASFYGTGSNPDALHNYKGALQNLASIMGPNGELAAVKSKMLFIAAAGAKLTGGEFTSAGLTDEQVILLLSIREARPSKSVEPKITEDDFYFRVTKNPIEDITKLEGDLQLAFGVTQRVLNYESHLDGYYKRVSAFVQKFNALKACEVAEENKPNVPGGPGGGPGGGGPGGGGPGGGGPGGGGPGENKTNSSTTRSGAPRDPNDKHGPTGYDSDPNTPGIQGNFIQFGSMPFEVEFENIGEIAAQLVVVTDQLSANLDWNTFTFNSFGFSNRVFQVPAGFSHYEDTIDLRPDGIALLVPVILDLNKQTGLVTVTFNTIDPLTGAPPDGFAGFLPVNDATHAGEGFFTYTVTPKATGLFSGTQITNFASIVFDTNDPIETPSTLHTLDLDAPSSAMTALAATINRASIQLNWDGTDGAGSGVQSFDIYVSDNGGAFTLFLDDATAKSAVFHGVNGHTYAFYSVAKDNVGLQEAVPGIADAITAISMAVVTVDSRTPLKFTDANGDKVTVTLRGLGTITATLERAPGSLSTVLANLDSLILNNTDARSALTVSVKRAPGSDGVTPIAFIGTATAKQSIGSITATGVTLGSGMADATPDLLVGGSITTLKLGDVAANSLLRLGADYTPAADAAAILALKPTLSFGAIAGAGVMIDINGGAKSFTAKSWAFDGSFTADGALGNITLKGALKADFTADTIGNVSVSLTKQAAAGAAIQGVAITAKSIGNITAGFGGTSALAAGAAIVESMFTATTGNIGNITASATSAKADAVLFGIEDSDFYAAGKIGKINATAKISARNATGTATGMQDTTILAGQQITIDAIADLLAAGIGGVKVTGAVVNTQIAANGSIGAVSVTANMIDSLILAGVAAGNDRLLRTADDTYHRHASIGNVTVGGAFTRSSLIAGIDPGDDNIWGSGAGPAADALAATLTGLSASGKIGAVTLGATSAGATPFRTPGTPIHTAAIEAAALTSVKIGRTIQRDFTTPVWIDANGNATEDATEVLLRKL